MRVLSDGHGMALPWTETLKLCSQAAGESGFPNVPRAKLVQRLTKRLAKNGRFDRYIVIYIMIIYINDILYNIYIYTRYVCSIPEYSI